MLLENPPPGRLTLASARSADARLLATYDDIALTSLLDSVRTPRGRLDFELLNKSFSQQMFDGAFLEGVHDAPIVSPMVWAVIIAAPETVARLLLCNEPEVSRFAAGCLIINQGEPAPAPCADIQARRQIAFWQQTVTRLIEAPTESALVRMDSQAMANMEDFRQQMVIAMKDGPGDHDRYLHQVPVLASKIALGLWAGCEDSSVSLTEQYVATAIELAELGTRARESLLQINAKGLAETEFHADCERVLGKIAAHGPISSKNLYRRIHGAKAEWIKPILAHLAEAEQITKLPDGTFKSCVATANDLKLASA
jgi:hypothetical protein